MDLICYCIKSNLINSFLYKSMYQNYVITCHKTISRKAKDNSQFFVLLVFCAAIVFCFYYLVSFLADLCFGGLPPYSKDTKYEKSNNTNPTVQKTNKPTATNNTACRSPHNGT